MIQAIIGAILIGLTLSVFGSGGSILTVPVLLYLVKMEAGLAIASSLLIVGGIAIFNGMISIKKRAVSWPHVWLFGIPGMVGTYLGAWLTAFFDSRVQLAVLVLLMAVAAIMMWKNQPPTATTHEIKRVRIVIDGLVVGAITGFVGVGGGFLIVPALVLLGGVPITLAVGSSLIIIAMKSFAGFFKYYTMFSAQGVEFDWAVIGLMIGGGVIGGLAGHGIASKLPKSVLQKSFAVFLVLMAIVILFKSVV